MSIKIKDNNRELSDEEILVEYQKRSAEYLEWRQQKAADFLQNKKREKQYRCEVFSEADEDGFEIFKALPDDIVARVRALKDAIAKDPTLKDDDERYDEYHDRIAEIGEDIAPSNDPMMQGALYFDIDPDDFIYSYRFDIHLLDWKGDANGRTFPACADLTDEEYTDLLALLLDQPNCSFQHMAHLSPKFKAIYEKVEDYLHNYDFNVFKCFCHEHDYAIRMTELRADAQTLLNQLEKNNDEYEHKGFLKDFLVNLTVLTSKPAKDTADTTDLSAQQPLTQQERLEKISELINQFAQDDNFSAAYLMKKEWERLLNKQKMQMLCPIQVLDDKIYVEFPGKKHEKVFFSRGNVAKTLYVFFLRQIERANQDKNVSPCLSQQEMEQYADELSAIYRNISGKTNFDVRSLFTKSTISNDFTNALSSIRRYFKDHFDMDALKNNFNKCYNIEIMGKDSYGNVRYGIGLQPEDFDLGWYSINKSNF